VREAVHARVAGALTGDGTPRLVAGGQLKAFRCAAVPVRQGEDGGLLVSGDAPFGVGDEVLHAHF
jgi:hypothetical protein